MTQSTHPQDTSIAAQGIDTSGDLVEQAMALVEIYAKDYFLSLKACSDYSRDRSTYSSSMLKAKAIGKSDDAYAAREALRAFLAAHLTSNRREPT